MLGGPLFCVNFKKECIKMTNANEMAQKGFDTGFIDANDNELHVGDYVRICGHIGKIVFSCGAFGIFITK